MAVINEILGYQPLLVLPASLLLLVSHKPPVTADAARLTDHRLSRRLFHIFRLSPSAFQIARPQSCSVHLNTLLASSIERQASALYQGAT